MFIYVHTHSRPSERCTPTRVCVCACVHVCARFDQCCRRPVCLSVCLSLSLSLSLSDPTATTMSEHAHVRHARSQDTCTRASSLPPPSTIPQHPSSLPHPRSLCVCLSFNGNTQRNLRWPRHQARENEIEIERRQVGGGSARGNVSEESGGRGAGRLALRHLANLVEGLRD
jgi:hypothetical protein